MPSFDVVSEVDLHQLTNAVDQANRLISTRFDFKGVEANFVREERNVTITAEAEFQIQQLEDMLRTTLIKCNIDPLAMDAEAAVEGSGKLVRKVLSFKHGLEGDYAKKLVKEIKASKIKVQTQIQGDQLRVTGKKRDDLQEVMALMRAQEGGQPLQFTNFRD